MISPTSRLYRTYRFLGSIWFLLINLGLFLVAMTAGASWGLDITNGALRQDWYGAWWFNILMAALMVNLTICTIVRKPWRNFWQWGFLITHTGILTLMIGSAITFNAKIYGDMRIPEGQTLDWMEIEHERELIIQDGSTEITRFDITQNRYVSTKVPRTYTLPKNRGTFRVEEYLANVGLEPAYEEKPGGVPVLRLGIKPHGTRVEKHYLKMGGQFEMGGGLLHFFYTMGPDAEFANMAAPSGEDGTLVLTIGGETREIDVKTMLEKPLPFPGVEVTVRRIDRREFSVHYEIRKEGGAPEEYFTTVSADGPQRKGGSTVKPDFGARFMLSPRESMIALVRTPSGLKYLMLSRRGKKESGTFEVGKKIAYSFMPQPIEIELIEDLKTATEKAVEEPPSKNGWYPAIRLTAEYSGESQTQWMKFGDAARTFRVGGEEFSAYFGGKRFNNLPFSLQLLKFNKPVNPGTNSPARFQSDVVVEDKIKGSTFKDSILVNEPYTIQSFVIYQASYYQTETGAYVSVFQVAWDPGKKLIYLGGLMAVSGTIFMFFFQPFLKTILQAGAKAKDPPLTIGATYLFLALACAGTIVGSLVFWMKPGVNGVFLGLGIAGADILLVAVIAKIASAMKASKPGRALQVVHALAASWCINTAALVIFMWMRVGG